MIAGAGELERRIAEHAHWRLADAVRDGRQCATDPDAERLIELGDGVRTYCPEGSGTVHANGVSGFQKRLVDGWWKIAPSAAV